MGSGGKGENEEQWGRGGERQRKIRQKMKGEQGRAGERARKGRTETLGFSV